MTDGGASMVIKGTRFTQDSRAWCKNKRKLVGMRTISREMAPGLIPAPVWWLVIVYNSSSRDPTLFWPLWALCAPGGTYTHANKAHIKTKRNIFKREREAHGGDTRL